MHVPDPSRALSEMSREVRVGGRMAVHDFDWESQFCNSFQEPHSQDRSFLLRRNEEWLDRQVPSPPLP